MSDLPSHAYVPGRTPRHAEDAFERIKASVSRDVPLGGLCATQAWRAGLRYLHAGYYWECHEVLEPVWLHTPDPSPEREMVQALIQLANARLKLRMQRPRAVRRLCDMVAAHLDRCAEAGRVMDLRIDEVRGWLAETRAELRD